MRTIIFVSASLAVWFQLCSGVTVTDGDFQFSLESVKALGAMLMGDNVSVNQDIQLMESKAAAVCSHPDLPEDFKPLCLLSDAAASLARLALIGSNSDPCEICAVPACTGC